MKEEEDSHLDIPVERGSIDPSKCDISHLSDINQRYIPQYPLNKAKTLQKL